MKEIQLNEIKYGDIIEIKSLEDYEEADRVLGGGQENG